jgi:hypothetical protein
MESDERKRARRYRLSGTSTYLESVVVGVDWRVIDLLPATHQEYSAAGGTLGDKNIILNRAVHQG